MKTKGQRSNLSPTILPRIRKMMKIPKILHQIWIGQHDMHPCMVEWIRKWRDLHSNWECRLWRDADGSREISCEPPPPFCGKLLLNVQNTDVAYLLDRSCNLAQRTNIWKYEILRLYGGLYVDVNMQPLRAVDPLLEDLEALAAPNLEDPYSYDDSFFGATPNHPWLLDLIRGRYEQDPSVPNSMGSRHMTSVTLRHPEVAMLPPPAFLRERSLWWATTDQGRGRAPSPPSPEAYVVRHSSFY